MFGKKLESLETEYILEDVALDIKTAKRIGQYKISSNAIYKPDGTYLPVAAITGVTADKTSVHVSGCCAGGVPVERLIFDTAQGRYPFIFDTKKDVEKVLGIVKIG